MDDRERSRAAGRRALQAALAVCLIVVLTGSADRIPLESLAADASGSGVATVVGLIGKATHTTQKAEKELSALLAAGTPSASELQPVFDAALAKHVQAGKDLRTAWALGVHPPQQGFYFAAAGSHRALNERLVGLLGAYWTGLDDPTAAEARLKDALAMVVAAGEREATH